MLKYNHYRGANDGSQHNCLVEWKNKTKTKTWINFFALSLNDQTPIIAFTRKNNVLHEMPFRHLVKFCKSKTEAEISRVQKVLKSPTCVKHMFGIQVPKGIKNAQKQKFPGYKKY